MKLTKKQERLADKLTDRQLVFANLVLKGMAATQSYRKAGYKCTTASTADGSASRMLKLEKVSDYISSIRATRSQESANEFINVGLTINEIIDNLKKHAGIGQDAPDYSNSASQVKASCTLLDWIEKYARPGEGSFKLTDASPAKKVSSIIAGMAKGQLSVYLGKALIDAIQIQIQIEEKTELFKKLEELEEKVNRAALPTVASITYSQAA